MGSVVGHLNAYQKERLGWLNYGSSPDILEVGENVQAWLEPYETTASGFPKALKILYSSSQTSTTTSNTYIYVEARTQTGVDSALAPGVLVHTGTDTDGRSSMELDLAPLSTTTDMILNDGQSVTFADAVQPVTIRTLSSDNAGAMVDISFGPAPPPPPPPPCVAATPTVGLSPSSTLWGPTGTPLNDTVTVTNNDSSTCSPSDFTLAAAVPAGWSSAFNPTSLAALAPGASASASLAVTASNNSSGTYSFTVSAVDGNSAYTGSASAFVVVASKLDVQLGASQVTARNGSSIVMRATVMIGQLPVPGASVTVTLRRPAPADGTTTLTGTTDSSGMVTVSYKLKNKLKDPPGTYQITADANKNGILGTKTINITVHQ